MRSLIVRVNLWFQRAWPEFRFAVVMLVICLAIIAAWIALNQMGCHAAK